MGYKLVLITNRKSHMRFRLVPKSMTLNDFELGNGRYFALFCRIRPLGANYAKVVEDRFILSATKM